MLGVADDTFDLITRIERVEDKVTNIEEKVSLLLEQGEVTQETVSALSESIDEQRDHFRYMKQTLLDELSKYQRIFMIGSIVLVIILMLILLRLM